jgi:hypothetical protein
MLKKSTTFFDTKFIDYTGLMEKSLLAVVVAAYILEFDIITGFIEPV